MAPDTKIQSDARPAVVQDPALVELGINVIRGLAMDAPEKANSGHSGTAMALAPLAHVLWTRIMRHDPTDPEWPDRDRFVLSNGHASILLYSLLHLTGYDLSLEDIRQFRQWDSKTPGHPERRHTAGVEVTTGPLGQGVGNAVGLAIAERFLRTKFGPEVCDHRTFVIAGDGCLMEGISHEAASLAGHLGLGRLIAIYDDNHITIDGPTELALNDDPAARFAAYGWHVRNLGEMANDPDALEAAIRDAMESPSEGPGAKPTLLVLRSHIGYPSPKLQDTATAHGSPFGAEEISVVKKLLGLPADETFWVPDEVRAFYSQSVARGQAFRAEWEARFAAWDGNRAEWDAAQAGHGLEGWSAGLPTFEAGSQLATRQAINKCINGTVSAIPGLIAGSADLTGNNGVAIKDSDVQGTDTPGGIQLHFGVREHAMGSVMNGLALHGGVLPVGGTFFVFSDYMRPAVRLAALSKAHVIYSWTHDSVGLGEDGPTHQPVEHLASLAGHARTGRGPSGRRQRNGAGLGDGRQRRGADRLGADPPGGAGAGRDRFTGSGRRRREGRLRTGRSGRRRLTRCRPDRHRQRSAALPRGRRRNWPRPAWAPAWSPCPAGNGSTPSPSITRTMSCPTARPRSAWKPAAPSVGPSTPMTRSGSTTSAPRPRARR